MPQIKAYNAITGKTQVIHPSFAKDKAYLAQRGLILEEPARPIQATNMAGIPETPTTPKPKSK
jgi:hypothetical protein